MKHNRNEIAYPTLPLDSKRVLTYRSQCQKPRELEEIWSWFVLRRVSIYVTMLLNRTAVTPNAISWLSVIFFVLTGWLLALGEPLTYVLAVISYNAGYMCDCIDGELARLKNVTSRRGYFLDVLIRACSIPIILAIALALLDWGQWASVLTVSVIYAIAVLATMALLVPLGFQLTYSEAQEGDPVGDMRLQSRRAEWLAFFLGLPGFFAVLLIGVIVETAWNVPFNTVFFTVFLSLFAVKTVLRLYITYKRIK